MSGKNRPPLDLHRKTEELLADILEAVRGGGGGGGSGGAGALQAAGALSIAGRLGISAAGLATGAGVLAAGATAGAAAVFAGSRLIDGAENAVRGGSFSAGVQRSLFDVATSTAEKFGLGEVLGFGEASRALQGAQSDLDSITNPIARAAGADAISPQLRSFLADTYLEQNKRVEQDRSRNAAAITDRIGDAAQGGTTAAYVIQQFDQVGKAAERLVRSLGLLSASAPSSAG